MYSSHTSAKVRSVLGAMLALMGLAIWMAIRRRRDYAFTRRNLGLHVNQLLLPGPSQLLCQRHDIVSGYRPAVVKSCHPFHRAILARIIDYDPKLGCGVNAEPASRRCFALDFLQFLEQSLSFVKGNGRSIFI